jgi:hypothetical protein
VADAIRYFSGVQIKDYGGIGGLKTVYLRTRRPKFSDNKKTNIVSYFRTGSFDLVNPSVLWEQKISRDGTHAVSTSINAEYIYFSGLGYGFIG